MTLRRQCADKTCIGASSSAHLNASLLILAWEFTTIMSVNIKAKVVSHVETWFFSEAETTYIKMRKNPKHFIVVNLNCVEIVSDK